LEEAEAMLPELEGLSKLNCRYIILNGEMAPLKYPHARGNAWFEEDGAAGVADGASGSAAGRRIELLSYTPNELRYHYTTPYEAKAVFSEIYYPEGWTLEVVDTGELLPISLSDDVFRSAILPAGEHELVMRFAPDSYARGYRLSLICSMLTLLLAAGAIVYMVADGRKQKLAEAGSAQPAASSARKAAGGGQQPAKGAQQAADGKNQKEN
jgi:hypothetical protein